MKSPLPNKERGDQERGGSSNTSTNSLCTKNDVLPFDAVESLNIRRQITGHPRYQCKM